MNFDERKRCKYCDKPLDIGLRLLEITLFALSKEIITTSKARNLLGLDMTTMRCIRNEYFKEEL